MEDFIVKGVSLIVGGPILLLVFGVFFFCIAMAFRKLFTGK